MAKVRSRLTSQCQVSVPAAIRRRLGLRPGAVLEWDDTPAAVTVRRAGGTTWEEIHRAAFPEGPPPPISVEQMDEGIAQYMREKYAKR